jgi:hypothetical protein
MLQLARYALWEWMFSKGMHSRRISRASRCCYCNARPCLTLTARHGPSCCSNAAEQRVALLYTLGAQRVYDATGSKGLWEWRLSRACMTEGLPDLQRSTAIMLAPVYLHS